MSASFSSTLVQTENMDCVWMDCDDSDVFVHLGMNCNKFSDPLTFHVAPSSGSTFSFVRHFIL